MLCLDEVIRMLIHLFEDEPTQVKSQDGLTWTKGRGEQNNRNQLNP